MIMKPSSQLNMQTKERTKLRLDAAGKGGWTQYLDDDGAFCDHDAAGSTSHCGIKWTIE